MSAVKAKVETGEGEEALALGIGIESLVVSAPVSLARPPLSVEKESRIKIITAPENGMATHIIVPGRVEPVTLSDIARGADLSLSHVSRVFSGDRGPSMDTVSRIAGYLGISMDSLYAFLRRVISERAKQQARAREERRELLRRAGVHMGTGSGAASAA